MSLKSLSFFFVLAGNLLGWSQLPKSSGKPLKSLLISSNFLAGLCEIYSAHVQFRSFRYLERMYLCILILSFCGFPFQNAPPPLHLTCLSLAHSLSSISSRREDCASYLRFSHWLRPSFGEDKQTQKQETQLVLISSYKYRLPSSFCLVWIVFQCLRLIVPFFFFLFLKFIVVYKRVVLIEATPPLLEAGIEFQK